PVLWYQSWVRRKTRQKPRDQTSEDKDDIKLSSNFYVQIVTQIGGGILFFTVFVHMIPDVRNNFEVYLRSNHSIFSNGSDGHNATSIEDLRLPYLEIAICLGFFAIYLTEVVMHSLLDRRKTGHGSYTSSVKEYDETSAILNGEHTRSSRRNSSHSIGSDIVIVIEHRSTEDIQINKQLISRFLHGLVIICTFSVHSIFDGISIAARQHPSEIWTVFIAIASHKLMIALIIGVELYEKCQNFLFVVFHMTVFSIMSPIGIFVVIGAERSVQSADHEANPVVILLSAIASGTILYIVFFEILQKTRVDKLKPFMQFISMAIGFGLMFGITTTLNED
ncbi:unnamed protein product, partial [Oppiella nova]